MQGRVILYDYDQSMLVWRDVPNPSHQVMKRDVKIYRDLGILGFSTESRNAIATTWTNLFFRGQLYWNPDFDVDAELNGFFANFYGPAAEPMGRYWNELYQAWEGTSSVDHEFFMIPEIYTPTLLDGLATDLAQARAVVTSDGSMFDRRLLLTEASFGVLRSYTQMVDAAASECDYAKAVLFGERGLRFRDSLTEMGGVFTTYLKMPERGAAWWPGEVQFYRDLLALADGTKGKLVAKTPAVWHYRSDLADQGLWRGWGWATDYASWTSARVDLQPRAQGLLRDQLPVHSGADCASYAWYACQVTLPRGISLKDVRVMFPGLFNSSWLYVNGNMVDWREQKVPWWGNDYRFSWGAHTGGALKAGANTLILRTELRPHPSGMFRRPFLYQPRS
jgi:hypothetical protein